MFPIIQIIGRSGSGKSLLCNDLQAYIIVSRRNDIYITNIIDTKELRLEDTVLLTEKYKYIVIDNADLLITEQIQELISDSIDEKKNYWIIMGRKDYWCVNIKCVGELIERREDRHSLFEIVYL